MTIEQLQTYLGIALIAIAVIGYLIMEYLGKKGTWFMRDIGIYLLYIGASLLGITVPLLQTAIPAT